MTPRGSLSHNILDYDRGGVVRFWWQVCDGGMERRWLSCGRRGRPSLFKCGHGRSTFTTLFHYKFKVHPAHR